MASGFGTVGSVLTERPPSDEPLVTPVTRGTAANPPSAGRQRAMPMHAPPGPGQPLIGNQHHVQPARHELLTQYAPLTQQAPAVQQAPLVAQTPPAQQDRGPGNRAWYDSLLSGREYEVVYDDAEGYPLLAFTDGQWYDVTSFNPRPVSVRYAIHLDPAWAGAVVQTVCSWMRSNPNHDRSFELATELALAMGELARLARS